MVAALVMVITWVQTTGGGAAVGLARSAAMVGPTLGGLVAGLGAALIVRDTVALMAQTLVRVPMRLSVEGAAAVAA